MCPRPVNGIYIKKTQALHACDKELQVTLNENRDYAETIKAMKRASSEEVPESQVLPTMFVRHGRVVADHLWRMERHALHLLHWPNVNTTHDYFIYKHTKY